MLLFLISVVSAHFMNMHRFIYVIIRSLNETQKYASELCKPILGFGSNFAQNAYFPRPLKDSVNIFMNDLVPLLLCANMPNKFRFLIIQGVAQ